MKQLIINFFLAATITAIWSISIWLIFHPAIEIFAILAFSGATIIGFIVAIVRMNKVI